jgi:hypothetical protein
MDPPPLTQRDFLAAVQAVQQSWEARAREFSPGWTPADWARDLTHLISAEIWDQESLEARARVIRMLEKRRDPDICSGDFVRSPPSGYICGCLAYTTSSCTAVV